jgi:periplasmic protein TonB
MSRSRIENTSWLFSAAIHMTAYTALAGWWTVTGAEAPTFSGRRSIATVELRGSASGIAGELPAEREETPPEHELPLATIDAPDLPLPEIQPHAPTSIPLVRRDAPPSEQLPTDEPQDEPKDDSDDSESLAAPPSPRAAQAVAAAPAPSPSSRRGNAPVDSLAARPSAAAMAIGLDDATPPALARNPLPYYPPDAAARGVQGRVMLRILITAEGRVASIEVVTSTGYAMLDKAAVDAVRQWIFTPAHRAGRAIAWTTLLPVRFRVP